MLIIYTNGCLFMWGTGLSPLHQVEGLDLAWRLGLLSETAAAPSPGTGSLAPPHLPHPLVSPPTSPPSGVKKPPPTVQGRHIIIVHWLTIVHYTLQVEEVSYFQWVLLTVVSS